MRSLIFTVFVALSFPVAAGAPPSSTFVISSNVNADAVLREAIGVANQGGDVVVLVRGDTEVSGGVLPAVNNGVLAFVGEPGGAIMGRGSGPLLQMGGSAQVAFVLVDISGFGNPNGGGALIVDGPEARLDYRLGTVSNNTSQMDGGFLLVRSGSALVSSAELTDNAASGNGGAISSSGSGHLEIQNSIFSGNMAGIFGCDVDVNSSAMTMLRANHFNSPDCPNAPLENPFGPMQLLGNTLLCGSNCFDSTANAQLQGNVLASNSALKSGAAKAACNDFGSNAFDSEGFNLDNDGSCGLDQPTDLPNTDPELEDDDDGIAKPKPSSPLVEAALANLTEAFGPPLLPCGYKDAKGLGRPQDADLDGTFECDIGSVELQGGPDIGAAQSGAFFDTTRNGEGVFVELIGGGLAFVAMFTYAPDGNTLTWFVGIGQVVGNSVVIDDVLITSGGVFGEGFNADAVVRTRIGAMSLVFPSCEGVSRPGKLAFQAETDAGFEDLLQGAQRLTNILNCSGAVPARSGRSGSFYDPARDGEGIFVQWLPNGQVVVIWYTYDPEGNQFWTISSDVTVDGDTVTATMVYPGQQTSFGQNFDADEIVLQTWGTIVLEYDPGCGSLEFSYDSEVPGFGSGSYDYTRLTSLTGTSCDL